jgi:alginate O-acetyltransferase complex protein AlgI
MKTEVIIYIILFAAINLALVFSGFILLKRKWKVLSWLLLIASIGVIHILFLHEHPIIRMLALIATTFTAMKPIAAIAGYKDGPVRLTFIQWCAFAGGWAGMRPQPFETLGGPPLPNAWPMVRFGISRVIAGGLLIVLAHFAVKLVLPYQLTYILVSAMLLVGLSLVLHFGLLSISAGMWRFSGANTYFLFRQPATALSLTEFWGKRWNLAFIEMTAVAVFRPLKNSLGNGGALIVSFIFSGLLHEIALSVPVNAGYGLPTLYFIIQACVVLIEKRIPLLKNKLFAHIWVFIWLVVPMPLLFHEAFIKQIVWPIVGLHA